MPHIFVPQGDNVTFDSPILRLKTIREVFKHVPAWRVQSLSKGSFYICGRCFASMGNGPRTNAEEMWTAGANGGNVVPADARCEQCGGRAWPQD